MGRDESGSGGWQLGHPRRGLLVRLILVLERVRADVLESGLDPGFQRALGLGWVEGGLVVRVRSGLGEGRGSVVLGVVVRHVDWCECVAGVCGVHAARNEADQSGSKRARRCWT